MTFFFDNHHSPRLLEILRERDVDVVHLRDLFADRGVDDVIWLPEVAARGWIVVTGDLRIRSRRQEKSVFEEARLVTFFLAAGYTNKTRQVQIRWIIDQWSAIERLAVTAEPGDCFVVPRAGRIVKLEAP